MKIPIFKIEKLYFPFSTKFAKIRYKLLKKIVALKNYLSIMGHGKEKKYEKISKMEFINNALFFIFKF